MGDDSGYFYGSAFMMANIAARACEPAASADELLLFAVLAVFLMDDFPGVDPEHWEGVDLHLRSAFNYFKELGDTGAARKLRMEVIERSVQEDPPLCKELRNNRPRDPAREALQTRTCPRLINVLSALRACWTPTEISTLSSRTFPCPKAPCTDQKHQ